MTQITDLHLILHKVRGSASFDVARRDPCVHCQVYESVTGETCYPTRLQAECHECNHTGYWWIIPTTGHRAYPQTHFSLEGLEDGFRTGYLAELLATPLPDGLRDHYHSAPPRPRNFTKDFGKVLEAHTEAQIEQLMKDLDL